MKELLPPAGEGSEAESAAPCSCPAILFAHEQLFCGVAHIAQGQAGSIDELQKKCRVRLLGANTQCAQWQVLEGDRLVNTPYDIKFRVDKENEDLCSRELTPKDLKKFRKAVKKDYYFQVNSCRVETM